MGSWDRNRESSEMVTVKNPGGTDGGGLVWGSGQVRCTTLEGTIVQYGGPGRSRRRWSDVVGRSLGICVRQSRQNKLMNGFGVCERGIEVDVKVLT